MALANGRQSSAATLPSDPQIEVLIARINDAPDLLHSDYTPAVHDLIRIGQRALPHVLTLMESDDKETRMRAIHVLEIVTMKKHGFMWGQGWKTTNGEREWSRFWKSLGDLRFDAPLENRKRSVQLWREWLERRSAVSPIQRSSPPTALTQGTCRPADAPHSGRRLPGIAHLVLERAADRCG